MKATAALATALPEGQAPRSPRWRPALRQTLIILAPFALFAIFLLANGVNPLLLYRAMFVSTFGDLYGFGEVLIKATPFVLTGLAAALPARAGMINVGGEGQLAIGALVSTGFAVFLLGGLPSWLGIPLMLLAGAVGGALWAGVVALLKVKGNLNETITSLLLNYVAAFTVGLFVHGLLKDPESFNWPFSPEINWTLRLPIIDGTRLHVGFVIAIVLALAVWYVLGRTRLGFRIRVLGGNRLAAERAGMNVSRMQLWVLIAAGALAGIAGMIEIAGIEGRLRPSTGVNYGYLGFLAAWMAWNKPLRLLLTAFVLGMISVAGNSLEIGSGLPSSSVHILMALVLFFLLGSGAGRKVKT
ncbi:ABC transporter permease [Paenibacillus sp. IB182496]|uniref:ABC transporter permease n=1 Tax=Paenibacillus sabuli TaxID=2772509 RepID=A0A927BUI3_9BACL|nr:ABC transporter permease [Paenibacillus sabuli]MBD2847077.1 ABC transporter permease [Paenibacillus sabuli]